MLWLYIRDFSIAVISHWVPLVIGGIIAALVAIMERLRKRPIVGWPFGLVICASIFVSFLFAWGDRRFRLERLHPGLGISLSPQELVRVFEGRITDQSMALLRSYYGKWMEISGVIIDVGPWGGNASTGITAVTLRVKEGDEPRGPDNPFVVAKFDKKWAKTLAGLQPGERIKVIAQIYSMERYGIWLENGELVDIPR